MSIAFTAIKPQHSSMMFSFLPSVGAVIEVDVHTNQPLEEDRTYRYGYTFTVSESWITKNNDVTRFFVKTLHNQTIEITETIYI